MEAFQSIIYFINFVIIGINVVVFINYYQSYQSIKKLRKLYEQAFYIWYNIDFDDKEE